MHKGSRICVITIFAISFILLFTITFYIQFIIRRPLSRLLAGVDEVKKGNLLLSLKIIYNDEIGILTDSFNTIHHATQNNEFTLVFQPIINQKTKKPESFEALIR